MYSLKGLLGAAHILKFLLLFYVFTELEINLSLCGVGLKRMFLANICTCARRLSLDVVFQCLMWYTSTFEKRDKEQKTFVMYVGLSKRVLLERSPFLSNLYMYGLKVTL